MPRRPKPTAERCVAHSACAVGHSRHFRHAGRTCVHARVSDIKLHCSYRRLCQGTPRVAPTAPHLRVGHAPLSFGGPLSQPSP